jgi:hypothetical protein
MRSFAERVTRVATVCIASAATVCAAGCLMGTREWIKIDALTAAGKAIPPGCDGQITRLDGDDIKLTRDDRYGAAEVRLWGATAIGSQCSVSMHVAYVKRDTTNGPFTWAPQTRNLIIVGAPEGPPPEGAPGEALQIGRPVQATIPPAGAAVHALTLAAGDAVTLAASGEGATEVGVWLGGVALPWARAPGLPTQEFFVAPVSATYTVRVAGDAGKAYVVFAVHGGSSGTLADDAPPRS